MQFENMQMTMVKNPNDFTRSAGKLLKMWTLEKLLETYMGNLDSFHD